MGRRSPIAPSNSFQFRRAQLEDLACIDENDLLLIKQRVGIKTRRKLGLNFRIAVHRRGRGVRGPALQKRFARGDSRLDVDLYSVNFIADLAPAGWPEFAESVVLRSDALNVKEQVTLTFAYARISPGRSALIVEQCRGPFTHSFPAKNQIARQ